jgi:Amt family ammonium transporter
MSGTIPESLFIIFQMTFAIITAAIITGAVAERMKFSSLLVFIFFWHLLVYCPIAHWEWGGGFMGSWGVLDFAGGDVVHISSGVSGLVAAFIVGKRKAFGQGAELPPHNVLLTFIGASLLWVGWFGFNAGSALSAGTSASMAMLVTHIAACSAGLTWMFTEWLVTGKPTVLGIVSGAIAGLVVITPGAGYVDHTGAFVMGIIGGWGCYLGIQLKHIMGYDDALDAFGVHGVGGIIGGVLTGLFANPAIAEGTAGAFYNNAPQLGWQIAGILVTAAYSAGMTAVILVLIKVTLGLRVSSEDEDLGLDISEHGHAFEEQHKAVTSAGPQVPMVMTPFGLQPVPGFPGGPVPYRP